MFGNTHKTASPARQALFVALLYLLVQGAQCDSSAAQDRQPDRQQQQSKQPEQRAQSGELPMPDVYALNMRIRTTIIALNQANITGNYTVFRELATPNFQQSNNPARLTEIFADLRNRKVDMSPVFFINPKLVRKPEIRDGLLRLSGYFPTNPEQINFDMMFQRWDGRWRLHGIAVDTSPAKGTANAGQASRNTGAVSASASASAPRAGAAPPNPKKGEAPQSGGTRERAQSKPNEPSENAEARSNKWWWPF